MGASPPPYEDIDDAPRDVKSPAAQDADGSYQRTEVSTDSTTAGPSQELSELVPTASASSATSASRRRHRLKDKITGSTHEQRDAQRKERTQKENETYERHRLISQAFKDATRTGLPQYIGKDPETGADLYIEPTNAERPPDAREYQNPNAKFITPAEAYRSLPITAGRTGAFKISDFALGGGM